MPRGASRQLPLLLAGLIHLSLVLPAARAQVTGGEDAAPPAQPQARRLIEGHPLPPEAIGPGVVETMEQVLQRDRAREAGRLDNPKARNGAPGVWVVPSRRATYQAHSGVHYITNKWGDTRMGIGFPAPVDVRGAFIAGQAGEGVWADGLRVIGFREGREVGRTDWFRQIGAEPQWFQMDLAGVDRIVLEAMPAWKGGGWYALDDLTFQERPTDGADRPKPRVLDFEDTTYRQKLTGTDYAGLTWEEGTGDFKAGQAMPPPAAVEEADDGGAVKEPDVPVQGVVEMGTSPTLVSDFQGVIRGDASSFTFPPDTCGAAGPNHFVETVNRNFSVYDKSTGVRLVNTTLGSFLPGSNGDPRVLFDQHSGRWVVIVSDFDTRIFLAVSTTDDPTGSWFKTNFVVSEGPDAGCFPDYPTLGVNDEGVYIGSFMVGCGMSIFALDKAPLIADPPSLGTITAFRGFPFEGAIQPVHTYGVPGFEYFISVRWGVSNQLKLRRLLGPLTSPTLEELSNVTIMTAQNPPDAPALGSGTPLDTIDRRLMNAVYRDGSIWTTHAVLSGGRAACRWYQIDAATSSVLQTGTVFDSSLSYYMPSIMVDSQGSVLMGFSGSDANQYAAAYFSGRRFDDPPGLMASPGLLQAGSAPQNNIDGFGRNRWGDYSLCSLDPIDELTMWTIQEYAHGTDIWGTWIGEFNYFAPPANDQCATAQLLSDGATSFTNVNATTDGPAEPAACGGAGQVESDVWFKYLASCTGLATFSVCGSDFDTVLAAYDANCPTGADQAIACNDDACGVQSELTIPVTAGATYRIRVGGSGGAQGSGVLTVSCVPGLPCPGDLNGDLNVDVLDLLDVLAVWGPCIGCPEDLNGDGTVDVLDLLDLLAGWGPCP